MDINMTVAGQVIFVFALVMGVVCYYIGRRKSQTPVLTGLLGGVLSLIPLFGVIYLVVLVLKKDVGENEIATAKC
ncbi:hypothetical protein CWE15_03760 [Aliidiomarina taiwanensis]|uniref:Uncharacterized protein n=1 Tax=Aliidiomarina taiwanensis TaxID=946228 RepID=A0A432XAG0_9GAMM|nr:glycosyltransferase 87 family protein [Aliidiomarina taiwanensis]RUO44296.1 hypothetical protein CWE15_03760 [Aliidiomarina taiwanensis]